MATFIPQKLDVFFKNACLDLDDGYEYSTELNRLLCSSECQEALSFNELDALRHFAEEVNKIGEINHYSEERIKQLEIEIFGQRGVLGYLSHHTSYITPKPQS